MLEHHRGGGYLHHTFSAYLFSEEKMFDNLPCHQKAPVYLLALIYLPNVPAITYQPSHKCTTMQRPRRPVLPGGRTPSMCKCNSFTICIMRLTAIPTASTYATPLDNTNSETQTVHPSKVCECKWRLFRKIRTKMILLATWLYSAPALKKQSAQHTSQLG